MRRAGFFIPEAFRSLRRNAAPSVAATVTIIVTVWVVGVSAVVANAKMLVLEGLTAPR
jgi:cell division protein FtsX